MNKKALVVACGLIVAATSTTFAQKAKIRESNRYYQTAVENITKALAFKDPNALNGKDVVENLTKAKEAADAAVANPETAENADAWFAKAMVMIAMAQVPDLKSQRTYVEGMQAMEKALALNPKIVNKDGIDNALFNAGIYAINHGVQEESNKGKYDDMLESVSTAKKAFGFNNATMFKDKAATRDTLINTSDYYIGFAHYNKKDYPKAIEQMEHTLKSPIGQSNVDAFRILIFAYGEAKQFDKQIATIEAAKAKFPTNKDLEVDELNYYITQNKTDLLIGKLEKAVAKEPNNAQYNYNLGVLYRNMGMEKDGEFPADATAWHDKAEKQLKKALELDPTNPAFLFNLSSLYVIKGDLVANRMNKLGSSKEENRKYDEMVVIRKGLLEKGMEPLLKVESMLDPKIKSGKISAEERGYLLETLQTLGRLYGANDDAASAKKYREKLRNYEEGNFN